MLVDDDCMLAPDVLEHLRAQLERTPSAVVGPVSTTDGTNRTWTAHPRLGVRRTVAELPSEPYAVRGFAFHGMLLNADHVRSFGGPRADFFLGAEDVELCRRYASNGVQFLMCPAARAQHHAPAYRNFWLLGRRRVPRGTPGHRYYVLRNRLIVWRLYRGSSLVDGVLLTFTRELAGALLGGHLLRRVRLLTRALRHGLVGQPSRELPTDVPVFR
jgi:GT2 family glycosyltransferase